MATAPSNLMLHGLVFVYHDRDDTPRKAATRMSTPTQNQPTVLAPSLEGGGQGEGGAPGSNATHSNSTDPRTLQATPSP